MRAEPPKSFERTRSIDMDPLKPEGALDVLYSNTSEAIMSKRVTDESLAYHVNERLGISFIPFHGRILDLRLDLRVITRLSGSRLHHRDTLLLR